RDEDGVADARFEQRLVEVAGLAKDDAAARRPGRRWKPVAHAGPTAEVEHIDQTLPIEAEGRLGAARRYRFDLGVHQHELEGPGVPEGLRVGPPCGRFFGSRA